MKLRRLAILLALLLVSTLSALPAAAESWSMSVDLPIGSSFNLKDEEGANAYKTEGIGGILLGVTTPYHVGFGYENYEMTVFPEPDFSLTFKAQFLDFYVELPVTDWLTFIPGAGWGAGEFNTTASDIDTSRFEVINLWQFFGVLSFRIPWDLAVRIGYHEARGEFVQRDRSQTPIEVRTSAVKTTLTTIGLGYTF